MVEASSGGLGIRPYISVGLIGLVWLVILIQKVMMKANFPVGKPFPIYYWWHPILNSLGVVFMAVGTLISLKEEKGVIAGERADNESDAISSADSNAGLVSGAAIGNSNQSTTVTEIPGVRIVAFGRSDFYRRLHMVCMMVSAVLFFSAYFLMYHQHELGHASHFAQGKGLMRQLHVTFGYLVLLTWAIQFVGGLIKWKHLVDPSNPQNMIKWHGILGRVGHFLVLLTVTIAVYIDLTEDSWATVRWVLMSIYIAAAVDSALQMQLWPKNPPMGDEDEGESRPVLEASRA